MAKRKEKTRKIPQVKWVKIKTKSKAGVVYTKYVQEYPPLPVGFNRKMRRRLDAWARKNRYVPKV